MKDKREKYYVYVNKRYNSDFNIKCWINIYSDKAIVLERMRSQPLMIIKIPQTLSDKFIVKLYDKLEFLCKFFKAQNTIDVLNFIFLLKNSD